MKQCDIIIPTYNGAEKLKKYVIPALRSQFVPSGWEVRVIICDDGSDITYQDTLQWDFPWHTPHIIRSSRGGRSQVRNTGLEESSADVVLMLADDIVLRAGALAAHLRFHDEHLGDHEAALGCIAWDPRVGPTACMEWMMHGGQQNDYDAILGSPTCDPAQFFYGSFVSLKRSFISTSRFSEQFTHYGWEDLEFGQRLKTKGLTLNVLHEARALHHHHYSAHAILQRQRLVGAGATQVNKTTARRVRHTIYWWTGARMLIRLIMKKYADKRTLPRLFEYATAGEFWYGVYNGVTSIKNT